MLFLRDRGDFCHLSSLITSQLYILYITMKQALINEHFSYSGGRLLQAAMGLKDEALVQSDRTKDTLSKRPDIRL